MVILGIGLGIVYAGALRFLQFFIEFRDITAKSNEVATHVLRRVLEMAWWYFEEAMFLFVLGGIITLLGIWNKKHNRL